MKIKFGRRLVLLLLITFAITTTIVSIPTMYSSNIITVYADDTPWYKWKQNVGSWSQQALGSTTVEIAGCLVTSVAIQSARAGHDTLVGGIKLDPGTLVTSLNKNGGLDGGGNLYQGKIQNSYPDESFYLVKGDIGNDYNSAKGETALKLIKSVIDRGNYPIVRVTGPKTTGTHYMPVKGVDMDKKEIYVYDTATNVTVIKEGNESLESDFYALSNVTGLTEYASKTTKIQDSKDNGDVVFGEGGSDSEEGTNTESDGNGSNTDFSFNPFKNYTQGQGQLARIDNSFSFITQGMIVGGQNSARKINNSSIVLQFAIGIILIGYIVVCPIVYLAVLRGIVSPDKFKSLTGYDLSRSDEKHIKWSLMLQSVMLSVMVGLVLSNSYSIFLQVLVSGFKYVAQLFGI